MRLTLVVLRCADLARASAFYEALGLKLQPERHGDGPDHLSCLLEGGTVLELYPQGAKTTSGLRLGFTVPDVDAAIAAVRALGAAVNGTVVTDPDGHRVELVRASAG